ncbi:hypothetical protein U1Q18_020451 [Sarracenia purpurea var. burkii]
MASQAASTGLPQLPTFLSGSSSEKVWFENGGEGQLGHKQNHPVSLVVASNFLNSDEFQLSKSDVNFDVEGVFFFVLCVICPRFSFIIQVSTCSWDFSEVAASRLYEEHICSGLHLSTLARTAVSGKGWTLVIDIQPSPKKVLPAESCFAE